MSDAVRLATYIDVWWQAVGDFTALLEQVPEEAWSTPTDLPGWDVRAVAAHTAHLERVLATGEEEHAEVGEPPHVKDAMGLYTEIGVVNRCEAAPAAIIAEIRDATQQRYDALRADPPTDGSARPERVFGGVPWTWERLLRNRPLDVWMHEQDVRRAVGLPGGMDTPAAQHTADYLSESFGFVVGKRVAPPAGTTAVLAVEGSPVVAVEVGANGRGQRLADEPAGATVRIEMDRESFIVRAGGRRTPPIEAVVITGDVELGRRIVEQMATTP